MYTVVLAFVWKKFGRLLLIGIAIAAVGWLVSEILEEIRTSQRQASKIVEITRQIGFEVKPGPSDAIRFPGTGPYDQRMGYGQLPQLVERLKSQDFTVTAQARMSPKLMEIMDKGWFAPYREKDQAGLEIHDCRRGSLFQGRYPERVYENFEAVPPLLVNSLTYIEDRSLLDPKNPMRNPALEWSRLARAVGDQVMHLVNPDHPTPGGSTLATQIEKYRHSPEGRTSSMQEKLRQMASGSLRAYLDGEDTTARRREIVVDYINTVPLSAKPGFGEVNGIGDGMWAWYGRDFAEVNRLLKDAGTALKPDERQALAYKQALSLFIAQRRPSPYLAEADPTLSELTDSYLRVMADAGVITPALRDAALPLKLKLQAKQAMDRAVPFVERKAATAMRVRLSGLLGVSRPYDLDRLDLTVDTTLDADVQRAATRLLRSLKNPEAAKAAGLYGFRLLSEKDDLSPLVFSFTLFERGEHANLLRVQTDNFDQPFDINEGAKLDLGSTAKLRTLITYLDFLSELHARWSKLDEDALDEVWLHEKDVLGKWTKNYLQTAEDKSLKAMLEAAMQRTYSSSPAEGFFTGGGLHHFENFEPDFDSRTVTLHVALQHSVNLPFIRLMRDMVHHVMYRSPTSGAVLLDDPDAPTRRDYLARFADKEGREFIARFFAKYQNKSAQEAEELLLQRVRPTAQRLSAVFFALEPEGDEEQLAAFLKAHMKDDDAAQKAANSMFEKHGPERYSLADRGFIAGVHPLELWLVGFLRHHIGASLSDAVAASRDERQDVYQWLFKTRHKNVQDVRIRNLLELEAFMEIHRQWRKMGYAFESLTPSYATALGASGDRPAALAEMMGIIVNRGMRLPVERIQSMEFARGTPFETHLARTPRQGERVLPEEVADVVRHAVIDVVEGGTARRLKGTLKKSDGTVVPIGGKTGTGDHRFDVYGRGGQLISSRVVNRTATFTFLIGDRYFGTMVAYVQEPHAAKYKFTSAMPSQLLKALLPALLPLVEDTGGCGAAAAPATPAPTVAPLPVAAASVPAAASAPRVAASEPLAAASAPVAASASVASR